MAKVLHLSIEGFAFIRGSYTLIFEIYAFIQESFKLIRESFALIVQIAFYVITDAKNTFFPTKIGLYGLLYCNTFKVFYLNKLENP